MVTITFELEHETLDSKELYTEDVIIEEASNGKMRVTGLFGEDRVISFEIDPRGPYVQIDISSGEISFFIESSRALEYIRCDTDDDEDDGYSFAGVDISIPFTNSTNSLLILSKE